MDATFQFVNGPGAQVSVESDKLGNVTVKVTPYFRDAQAKPDVAYVTTRDSAGELITQSVLQLSGTNGDIQRRLLSQESVTPLYEKKRQEEAAAQAGATK